MLIGDAFVLIRRRRSVAVEPDVMFPRDVSQFLVIRHCRLLLLKFYQLLTLAFCSCAEGGRPSSLDTMRSRRACLSSASLLRGERIKVRVMSINRSIYNLQVASCSLFAFDGFEERLEISFAKALRAFALND